MAKTIKTARTKALRRATVASKKAAARPASRRVEFTHEDKLMFPEAGLTKGDVLRYYEQIAPLLLPHLQDRPITVERLPDGVRPDAPRFWQKNTPAYYPEWIPRVQLPTDRGQPVNYALINDVETLLYFVNQGTITFHPWLSRVQSLDRPDFLLYDLDRGEADFSAVVKIARAFQKILTNEGADPLVKTSGKSGLHVLVPWREPGGYDEAREWAMRNALKVVEALPDLATVERSKSGRHEHVYVDVIQNAKGHHVVPPYVIRAVPGATVSTPLEWKEVTPRLDPSRFTTKKVLERIKKQQKDPMASTTGSSS